MISICQVAIYLAVLKYLWGYFGQANDFFADDTARDIELLAFAIFCSWASWSLKALRTKLGRRGRETGTDGNGIKSPQHST